MTLDPGSKLDRFEIIAPLGEGGMGEVYRAKDPKLGRDVAIKVLHGEAVADTERLQRFMTEARVVSALNYPNIVTLHELGDSEFGPYIVTELVEGRTVREMLSDGPIPAGQARDIILQAAQGLAKAHAAGVIHRDIKPENLMLSDDGYVKVLDFGLAKLQQPSSETLAASMAPGATTPGTVIGTMAYLAPEILAGKEADPRTDVFGLGLVAHEMVTGKNPFLGGSVAETVSALLHHLPDPLPLDEAAASTIARAMAKAPEDRPSDAGDFASVLEGGGEYGERTSNGEGQRSSSARHRVVWFAAVACIMFIATGTMLMRGQSRAELEGASIAPAEVAIPADQTAIAIFPMIDATRERTMADGNLGPIISDAISKTLTGAQSLYVISEIRLDSEARVLGRPLSDAVLDPVFARTVGHRAQAHLMLTGRLSQNGDEFSLEVAMTDILTGQPPSTYRARSSDRDHLLDQLVDGVVQAILADCAPNDSDSERLWLQNSATASLDAYSHYYKGAELVWEGRWVDAVPELEAAIDADHEMGLAWSMLGCAYSFALDESKSHAAQRKAEEFLGRVTDKERRWIELQGTWIESLDWGVYSKECKKFVRDYPDDREGYFYMGLGAEWLGGGCETALDWYKQAYALTPVFFPITKGLVDCNNKLNRPAEARAALERYMALPLISNHGRSAAEALLASMSVGS